jgi:hypothetical protein
MAVDTNGRQTRKITRDDLEAAFSKVLGEGEATTRSSMPVVALVGGAVVLTVLTVVFLAGKRRGRRTSAVVEVRRL